MNERRKQALINLIERGASEGEREAARQAYEKQFGEPYARTSFHVDFDDLLERMRRYAAMRSHPQPPRYATQNTRPDDVRINNLVLERLAVALAQHGVRLSGLLEWTARPTFDDGMRTLHIEVVVAY